jgi:hypothetical protein
VRTKGNCSGGAMAWACWFLPWQHRLQAFGVRWSEAVCGILLLGGWGSSASVDVRFPWQTCDSLVAWLLFVCSWLMQFIVVFSVLWI